MFVQNFKWRQAKKSSELWFVSWWLRVMRRAIISKRPVMLSDGIILLRDNARPHTANLVRDKLQRFGWETLQHPLYSPYLSHLWLPYFWRPEARHSWTSVSFGRGNARVGEVVDPSTTYLFVQDWNWSSRPSGINVLTLLAITFEWSKFHFHFAAGVRFHLPPRHRLVT